jgi:hypothetical protein
VNVMLEPIHTLFVEADTFTDGEEAVFTTIVKLLLFADVLDAHTAFDTKLQVMMSPLLNEDDVYELLFVPTFEPFNFHWKAGVDPPFVIDAVKVADTPAQMLGVPVDTDMVGVAVLVMIIVTLLDVAVEADTQVAFDVIKHDTTSLFTRVEDE